MKNLFQYNREIESRFEVTNAIAEKFHVSKSQQTNMQTNVYFPSLELARRYGMVSGTLRAEPPSVFFFT